MPLCGLPDSIDHRLWRCLAPECVEARERSSTAELRERAGEEHRVAALEASLECDELSSQELAQQLEMAEDDIVRLVSTLCQTPVLFLIGNLNPMSSI